MQSRHGRRNLPAGWRVCHELLRALAPLHPRRRLRRRRQQRGVLDVRAFNCDTSVHFLDDSFLQLAGNELTFNGKVETQGVTCGDMGSFTVKDLKGTRRP